MHHGTKRGLLLVSILTTGLLSGCVWLDRKEYEDMQAKDRQQQQQISADANEKTRLQGQVTQTQAQLAEERAERQRLIAAIRYTVNADLLFPSGGWQMSSAGQQVIARLSSQLAPNQRLKLVVNGYTDNAPIGAALKKRGVNSNQELSERRAQNVMQYMVSRGVKADMVSARGHGERDPVASNTTAQGRNQNRRVEISLAE